MRVFVIAGCVVLAAAAAWYYGSSDSAPEPAPASTAATRAAADAGAAPETEQAVVDPGRRGDESGTTAGPAGTVKLPDGSVREALNGVVGAPAITWDPGRPWSPIVEIRRFDDGLDWFVHADGTRSTTRYFFRPDLGREDASTLTQHPRDDFENVRIESGGQPAYAPTDRR